MLVVILGLILFGAGLSACSGSSADDMITTSSLAGDQRGDDGSASTDTTSAEVDTLEWPMLAPTVIDVPHEEVASAIVSSEGAAIEYGPVRLDIPAGALGIDTTISISHLSEAFHDEPGADGGSETLAVLPVSSVYDFGPAGVRFDKPVTITLPYNPGMGPDGIDPEKIGIAYFNGKNWAIAGGTVDPETRTVSVQVNAFEGVSVRAILGAIGPAAWAFGATIEYIRGPDSTSSDPVIEGKAKDWIALPNDSVVQTQASKAVLSIPGTSEAKALDDPDLATWLAAGVKQGHKPVLSYKEPNGTIVEGRYNEHEGSNWQKPSHYFSSGTKELGPLSGDCTDTTNAAVSIFTAKGFPAKGVYGYGNGGKGPATHVWGEVLIGGQVYRIDETGYLITPDTDAFNYGEYKPITDPTDPHYQCIWDANGQAPYNADWWKLGQFAGTYEGYWTLVGFFKDRAVDVPVEFTVDTSGSVTGSFSWSGPTGVVGEKEGPQTITFSGSFNGTVRKDGTLEADGPLKSVVDPVIGKGGTSSGSGSFPLKGTISQNGTFSGSLAGEGSQVVKATRQ